MFRKADRDNLAAVKTLLVQHVHETNGAQLYAADFIAALKLIDQGQQVLCERLDALLQEMRNGKASFAGQIARVELAVRESQCPKPAAGRAKKAKK
jgi:hypothetical protein